MSRVTQPIPAGVQARCSFSELLVNVSLFRADAGRKGAREVAFQHWELRVAVGGWA